MALLKKPVQWAGTDSRRLQQNDVPSPKDVPSPTDDADNDENDEDEAPELPPDEPQPPPIQDPPLGDGQKPPPYVVRGTRPLLHARDAYLVTQAIGLSTS